MTRLLARLCLLPALLVAPLALANSALADTKAELKQRFKQRDPQLQRAKDDGLVGETTAGFIDFVAHTDPTDQTKTLLADENADRKALYRILADELTSEAREKSERDVTPDMVAARNAERNFRRAAPAHFLMVEPQFWIQKKNDARYFDLKKLKGQGIVGETSEGLLALVSPDAPDAKAARLLEQENADRADFYQRIASQEKTQPQDIARKYADIHFQNARPGEWLRENSSWRKKS